MNELLSTALKLPTRLRSQDYIILNLGKLQFSQQPDQRTLVGQEEIESNPSTAGTLAVT